MRRLRRMLRCLISCIHPAVDLHQLPRQIVATLAGKGILIAYINIIQQSIYHLIFNSVDTKKFIDYYDKKESGEFCEDDWINIIQIGRFSPIKNQLFTAEIAQELKKRGEKIRILCVGNNGNAYEQRVFKSP